MYQPGFDQELMNNELKYSTEFSDQQNFGDEIDNGEVFQNPNLLVDFNERWNSTSGESIIVPDFSDSCIKFLGDILLEEGLDETPATEEKFRALQATEKSLYDALGERYTPDDLKVPSLNEISGFDGSLGDNHGVKFHYNGQINFELKTVQNEMPVEKVVSLDELANSLLQLNNRNTATSPDSTLTSEIIPEKEKNPPSSKKDRQRDEVGYEDGRGNNKQQASTNEDYVELEEYDDDLLLLYKKDNVRASNSSKKESKSSKTTRGKNLVEEEFVDLRALLNQCAQAVANFDLTIANDRLKRIRQHSSPYGDSIERASHYFANALEARIAGTGSTVTANLVDARISSSGFLKAYRAYIKAIPYQRMTYFLANTTIFNFAQNFKKIHIIDFGILLGLQWPSLIQALSERPGGPPDLRITGIEFPQHKFRPAERVEATGHRLKGYCERFNVPFRYKALAQNWDSIKPDDLKTESDELVIVNSIARSGTLSDEAKDAFLKLVKELNPNLFIHEVINGTFSSPFFVTRFKESVNHYSALFEVFEASIPREEHARQLIESEITAKELLNIVACEGSERVQRPESYKQWQVRSGRMGLKQIPLDPELFKAARATAKGNYSKDFVVDEDKNWMLQGWKGRIFCALSFWQPR